MRTLSITFYKFFLLGIVFCLPLMTLGQSKKLQKSYNWKYEVSKDVDLSLNSYDCDIDILTWDKPTVELVLHVTATGSDVDDALELDEYLKNLTFHNSPNKVDVDLKFWSQRTSRMNKTRLDLKGGDNISLTEFKISGEMKIPSGTNLDLNSKYSNIELADILGRLNLVLYNDKLYGNNVGENTSIEAKYCTLEFGTMKDVRAELYNTDMELEDLGSLTLNSKYSKVFGKNAMNMDLESYNDKYIFETTGDVSFNAKYSSFQAKKSGLLTADSYNCTVIINEVDDIKITSKYSKFEFINGRNCTVSSSYNDGFKSGTLNKLNITGSKYGSYRIGELGESLDVIEGYSDKFVIPRTGPNFKGIKLNSKYGKITLGVSDNLPYKLKANVKYPNFSFNEEVFKTKIKIKESSNLEYEGVKGTEAPGMPLFDIKGYQVSLTVEYY